MLRFIARRLLFAIPTLLILSVLVFVGLRLTTDPLRAAIGPQVRPEDLVRIKAALGLDKSGPAQYFSWLSHFARGDWGVSFSYHTDVAPIIFHRLWNTVKLMMLATILSMILSVALGVYSAVKAYSTVDYAVTGAAFFGISIPIFWFGLVLQLVLGFYLERWMGSLKHVFAFLPDWFGKEPLFYTGGIHRAGDPTFHLFDFLRHAALPSLALMVQLVAGWGRYERASMMEVLNAEYIRTARAKGLKERTVILKHGLRNALIPFVTILGIDIGLLFGGLIITEQIFSWPGMGTLFLDSLYVGDYPMVLAWLMVTAIFVIVFNLLADILYAVLDPRIRYE